MLLLRRCHHCGGTGGTSESPCYDCLGSGRLHWKCRKPSADEVLLPLCDIDEVCECAQDRDWKPARV